MGGYTVDTWADTSCVAHINADGNRQSLADHMAGTARLAAQFAAAFGAQEMAGLAGSMHDLGKSSQAFQARIRDPLHTPRVDHATAGAKEAWKLGYLPVAFAIAGHHGGLPDGGSKVDAPARATLYGRMKKELPPYRAWQPDSSQKAAWPPIDLRDNFAGAFFTRMLYSSLVDADRLDTEAFMRGRIRDYVRLDIATLLARLMQYVSGWWNPQDALNQKRCEILRTCLDKGEAYGRGLYTLTVPTGGGKTVSSLAFALQHAKTHGLERVIYVIPYTSIIEQNAQVFREILGDEAVLEHHSAVRYEVGEDSAGDVRCYQKALATENWDMPVIVTTAVQFFESLFANRPSQCRKLHNIANAVIIFDEAQMMPVPYLRPCVAAIAQLVQNYRSTAVLCTATQPALDALFAQFAPTLAMREICEDTQALYAFFRRTTLCDLGQIAQPQLVQRLRTHEQALCVVNRRQWAQELHAQLPKEGRYCLTTLLRPCDRKAKLREIRARLKDNLPCRVVSTSLIEAGVDVDFPVAYREEAGLDAILQTAGRCNREGKRTAQQSPVYIFRTEQKAPRMLEQNVASTRQVLKSGKDPAAPESIAAYFAFYRSLKGDVQLDEKGILDAFYRGLEGSCFPFAGVARRFRLMEDEMRTIYVFTRAEDESGRKLRERLRDGERTRALFRALGAYGVNVYPAHFQRLLEAGALEVLDEDAVLLADETLYDSERGLQLDVETGRGLYL